MCSSELPCRRYRVACRAFPPPDKSLSLTRSPSGSLSSMLSTRPDLSRTFRRRPVRGDEAACCLLPSLSDREAKSRAETRSSSSRCSVSLRISRQRLLAIQLEGGRSIEMSGYGDAETKKLRDNIENQLTRLLQQLQVCLHASWALSAGPQKYPWRGWGR